MKKTRPPYLVLILVGIFALSGRLFGYWQMNQKIEMALGVGPAVAGTTAIRDAAPILPPYPRLTSTAPKFNARQYALYDDGANVFLAEGDIDRPVPLASTTKIMTCLLVIERGGLSDVVTVPKEASSQIGSSAELRAGEQLTVRSLLFAALLKSGNDAAYSLAYYLGGKIRGSDDGNWDANLEATVSRMNEKALELGLTSIKYVEPSGLSSENVSNARDLALLSAYALRNKTFKEMTSTPSMTIQNVDGTISHALTNSNRLVSEWAYAGAIGVKTGFTPEAGHNLVGAAERDGHRLIAVVLNTYSDTVTASATVARDMLDFAWRATVWE